jgi:lipopolysaccharide/colanic/teichoic acid biosynthesis glycosyltransferase
MPVTMEKSKREINMARARTAVTILFFLCVALTIASLFTDVGPSFYKCAAATVILHFVRQSALQMSENSS